MPRICPRPCSRLTTAAVFIAIGVVQLLVGIILLRSKFAELVSGPDFMTASANIGIGCVYGMAASVWKNKRKQKSLRQTAKNNVLASLLVSIITVNVTTAAILIMGDGNKLLFMYLETVDRKSPVAFANEILAGAYVASVCSPIVCIVIAIVALSGSCYQYYENKYSHLETALDVESPYGWALDPKTLPRPKLLSDYFVESPLTSDQSSRYSEDSVFSDNVTGPSPKRKSSSYIASPVNTWSQKRKNMLRNSRLLQKRAHMFDSLPKHEMRQLPNPELATRSKESSILRKTHHHVQHVPCCDSLKLAKQKRLKKSSSVGTDPRKKAETVHGGKMRDRSSEVRFAKNSPGSSAGSESSVLTEDKSDVNGSTNSFEYFTEQKSMPSDANFPRNVVHVDDLTLRHAEAHLMEKINPTLMKLKNETLRELKTRMNSFSSVKPASIVTKQQSSGILKKSNQDSQGKFTRDSEEASSKIVGLSKNDSQKKRYIQEYLKKVNSSKLPINPLPDPTSSSDGVQNNSTRKIHDSILTGIKSTKFDFSQRNCQSIEENISSDTVVSPSIASSDGKKKITNLVLDSPKEPSIKLQNRKRDAVKRMSSMESITEIPSEEAGNFNKDENSTTQNRSSTSQDVVESFLNRDENSNILHERNPTVKSKTLKRKNPTNSSIKNMLKGIWSSNSEVKLDISDLVMDDDSLIGLSEEDLISRTYRIRALRKAVADRLKSTAEDEQTENPVCTVLPEE